MDIAKIRKKLKGNDLPKGELGTKGPFDESEQAHESTSRRQEPGETKAIAEHADESLTGDLIIELLVFSLSKEDYAFRIHEVQEILKPQRITRVPKAEPYLIGVTSLRGKVIPIIDLKARLALSAATEQNKKQRILILKGRRGAIGAIIDRVIGVIRLPQSKIEETPSHLLETEVRFIDGVALVGGRFISIIKTSEVMDYAVGNGG